MIKDNIPLSSDRAIIHQIKSFLYKLKRQTFNKDKLMRIILSIAGWEHLSTKNNILLNNIPENIYSNNQNIHSIINIKKIVLMRNQPTKLTDELQHEVSNLIKRMKQRQQEHRRIYQYNNRIIASREELEQNIFIHDQISKHRAFINQRKVIQLVFNQNDQQITDLCNQIEKQGKEVMTILIKRVISRTLEIAFWAIDIMTEPIQYYLVSYNKFKMLSLEVMNNNQDVKLGDLVSFFSKYFHHKISTQIDRLKEVIYCLQVGDFSHLQNLKQNFYAVLMRKQHPNIEKIYTGSSPVKKIVRKLSPFKQTMSQKKIAYQKIKKLQLDAKKKEKIKKGILKKIVRAISEVMEICKEQLMEDLSGQNKTWESRRMYTDLVDRNKANCSHVQQFRTKSDNYQQVVARHERFGKSFQEEYSSVQEKEKISQQKNQQALITKKFGLSAKEKRSSQPVIAKKQQKYQNVSLLKGKMKPTLHRLTINNVEQSDQLVKQKVFASQKQIAYEGDFVQISIKQPNNGNKQRLPQIYTRATSVDAKKSNIIKIIEKQMKNKNRLSDENGQKEILLNTNSSKQIQVKVKKRQKTEDRINLEMKTLGTNFFDEIDRKINYYCQMKKNLMC